MTKTYTLEIKTVHNAYKINVPQETGEAILQRWEDQAEEPASFRVQNDRETLLLSLRPDPILSLRLIDAELSVDADGTLVGAPMSDAEFQQLMAEVSPPRRNPYFETVIREHLGNKVKFELWAYDDHETRSVYLMPVRVNNAPPLDQLDLEKIREIFRPNSPLDVIPRHIVPPPPVVLPDSEQREYFLDYLREAGHIKPKIPGTKNAKAARDLFKERE